MSDFETHPRGTGRELSELRALRDELRRADPVEFEMLSAKLMRHAQRDAEGVRRELDGH